ncbi:hypothetical protein KMZ15_05235 [Mycoavidus sp. HKI]|uniref:gp53-like domain-containing protein n=1 Tax=Mycoavidus sp. HKI TaxID=2840467 RepID=UPI001CC1BDD7|nr:hypothetical protein [Mycoavidus sp. HKI]UAW63503.1 hypothetical protein KMZ15_05235 [Mycoavidus sp. HKI]
MQQKFFIKPFAAAGDRESVPNNTQITGDVSYEQGYGYDYQRDQAIDPLAKPIERSKLNAILHDMTQALQQYQVDGTPEWITKTDNEGKAYPYAKCARVRYRTKDTDPWEIYESLIDNNTATPSNTKKWARRVSEVASQEQALAGTDNSTIMTPLRVAQAYATQQFVTSNYARTDYVDTHYLKLEEADTRYLNPQQGDSRYVRREERTFPELKPNYQVLPNGLILQWNNAVLDAHGSELWFPLSFPNAVFTVQLSLIDTTPASSLYYSIRDQTKFFAAAVTHEGNYYPGNISWFAIGH